MIWALLALLGVPIWLIVGGLATAFLSRRNFQKSDGVFPLRIQTLSDEKFQRKAHGRWVHDVLIINKGLALVRTDAHGVQSLAAVPAPTQDIKGLGLDPLVFAARLDGGREARVAVPSEYSEVGIGPFSLA